MTTRHHVFITEHLVPKGGWVGRLTGKLIFKECQNIIRHQNIYGTTKMAKMVSPYFRKNIRWGEEHRQDWRWNKAWWILMQPVYTSFGSLAFIKGDVHPGTNQIHAKRRYWAPSQSNHPEWSSLLNFPATSAVFSLTVW